MLTSRLFEIFFLCIDLFKEMIDQSRKKEEKKRKEKEKKKKRKRKEKSERFACEGASPGENKGRRRRCTGKENGGL